MRPAWLPDAGRREKDQAGQGRAEDAARLRSPYAWRAHHLLLQLLHVYLQVRSVRLHGSMVRVAPGAVAGAVVPEPSGSVQQPLAGAAGAPDRILTHERAAGFRASQPSPAQLRALPVPAVEGEGARAWLLHRPHLLHRLAGPAPPPVSLTLIDPETGRRVSQLYPGCQGGKASIVYRFTEAEIEAAMAADTDFPEISADD